jgi:hypothetical protein
VREALTTSAPAGVTTNLTGVVPLFADVSEGDSGGPSVLAETIIGGLGALVILFFTFGTLPAILMPIIVAIASILNTFTLIWLLTYITDVSIVVQFLVALVGLGVAIDYALLMIFRFREELRHGADRDEAITQTMRHAGRARRGSCAFSPAASSSVGDAGERHDARRPDPHQELAGDGVAPPEFLGEVVAHVPAGDRRRPREHRVEVVRDLGHAVDADVVERGVLVVDADRDSRITAYGTALDGAGSGVEDQRAVGVDHEPDGDDERRAVAPDDCELARARTRGQERPGLLDAHLACHQVTGSSDSAIAIRSRFE